MMRFIACCMFLTFGLFAFAQMTELKSEFQQLKLRLESETKTMHVTHHIKTFHRSSTPSQQLHFLLPEQGSGVAVTYHFQSISLNGQPLDAFFLANPMPSGSLVSLSLPAPLFPDEIMTLGLDYQVTLAAAAVIDQVGVHPDFAFVQHWVPRVLFNVQQASVAGWVLDTQCEVTMPEGWDVLSIGALGVQSKEAAKTFVGFVADVPLLFLKGWSQETGEIEINGATKPIAWWIRDPEFDFENLSVLIGVGLGHQNMQQHLDRIEGVILPRNWVADRATLQKAGFLAIADDVSLNIVAFHDPQVLDPLSHYLWTFPGRMPRFWQQAWVAYWQQTMKDRSSADFEPQLHPFVAQFLIAEPKNETPWQSLPDAAAFLLGCYQGVPPWRTALTAEPHVTRLLELERILGKEVVQGKAALLQETLRKQGTYVSDTFMDVALFGKQTQGVLLDANFTGGSVSATLAKLEQRGDTLFFEASQLGLLGGVLDLAICYADGSYDVMAWQVASPSAPFEVAVSQPVMGVVLDPDFKFLRAAQMKRVWPLAPSETQLNPQLLQTWQHWLHMLLGGL